MRTCPGCGGVVGRDCFNPVECVDISNRIQEDNLRRLEEASKPKEERHFLDLSKEEQKKQNEFDLKEMALYYGGWDELRKVISNIENNEAEAAYERHCTDY